MPRKRRAAIEYASAIGSAAFDLHSYSNCEAEGALSFLARVNPELFDWLRHRLNAALPAPESATKPQMEIERRPHAD